MAGPVAGIMAGITGGDDVSHWAGFALAGDPQARVALPRREALRLPAPRLPGAAGR